MLDFLLVFTIVLFTSCISLSIYSTIGRVCFGLRNKFLDTVDLITSVAILTIFLSAIICILFDITGIFAKCIYVVLSNLSIGIFIICNGFSTVNKRSKIFKIVSIILGIGCILFGALKSLYLIY